MKIYLSPHRSSTYEGLGFMRVASIKTIDAIIDDAECTEIVVDGSLPKIERGEVEPYLAKLASKLGIGGKFTVIDIDCEILMFNVVRGFITMNEANTLLLSQTNSVCGLHTLEDVEDILKNFRLKIETKKYTKEIFTITGVRNVGI